MPLVWCLTLTDLHSLDHPCIPGHNPLGHGVWSFYGAAGMSSLMFCQGLSHPSRPVISLFLPSSRLALYQSSAGLLRRVSTCFLFFRKVPPHHKGHTHRGKAKSLPSEVGTRQGWPLSPLVSNTVLEGLAWAVSQKKDIAGIQAGKKEVKLAICRWHDLLCRKPLRLRNRREVVGITVRTHLGGISVL